MATGARLVSWALLMAGVLLGVAWACLHFWIVPRIGDFRPELERWAQQSLGVPVRIGALSAESTGWVPSFELREIALLDAQGQPVLRLPRVVVAISLRSVLQLRLDQLVLDAPELDVHLSADGRWQVAGQNWSPDTSGDSAAADWLFAQREVVIRGGQLRWSRDPAPVTSPATGAAATTPLAHATPASTTLNLREVDLVLRNSARHHDLRIDATPPSAWGERFVLMGRFRRSLLSTHAGRWADWSGQAYGYFPQVDVAQLQQHLPQAIASRVQLNAGQGHLRLWSDIDKGRWTGGVADVDMSGLVAQLDPQRPPLVFEQFSSRVGGKVHAKGFELFTRQLAFVDGQGLRWPGGNMALNYTHAQGGQQAKGRLQADQLDLSSLRDMLLRLPLAEPLHQRLQEQGMGGQVSTLQWRWQGDWQQPAQYDAQLSLKDVWLRHQAPSPHTLGWPGVQGAQVKVDMTQAGGRIDVGMVAGGAVFLPGILDVDEVPVRQLQAFAQWERKAGPGGPVWSVPQWQMKLANADLQGEWHGQWRADPAGHGPGWLDLQGLIQQADAKSAYRYLPMSLPESVRHYVRDAIAQGSYNGVKMKIKGDLAKLPFTRPQDGEFHFSGRVKDMSFDMVPAALLPPNSLPWPRLQGLQGQLSFDRMGMKLSDASARLGDASTGAVLNGGSAEIAHMGQNPLLQVALEGKGSAAQLLAVVQQSPIDALLSGALHDTQANGPVQWRLKLGLPLLALQKSQVQGTVVLGGNDVRMNPTSPWLEKAQGSVQFSESGFGLTGVKARLLGGPVQIEGGMRGGNPAVASTPVLLQLQGQVSAESLRTAPDLTPLQGLTQHLSGITTYSAQLGWRQGQPELSVQSTLEGLAIDLPVPLGKAARTALPLNVNARRPGPQAQDQIQLSLGTVASAHYVRDLSGAQPRVLRGSLALGVPPGQVPALPETGVTASVAFDHLLMDEWLALVPPPESSTASALAGNPAWASYLPTRLGLQARTLTADGRTLHQVVAGGTRDSNQWQANIDAEELSGHFAFRPSSGAQQGLLFARLSRLNLPPSSASDVEALLATPPAQLPALDIVVNALELRGKKLGRVEIEALNTEASRSTQASANTSGTEWQLKKFNITLPEGSLRSTGRWLAARNGSPLRRTEMNFVLDVKNAGELLNRLGTPDALRGGTGQLEGTVSWQGSPLALHYPSMDGRFDVRMGRGQFLKADAGAAKLLGVLSLQALPRRLLLDFRDVFSEGFAFDSVRGEVSIAHGMASTHNLQIRGVNALVQLEGSADIAHETQKLRVVILPEVDAGTASLLAGIAVNPVVGLTTFLAQLFLQNPLSRASTQEFTIDGNWADPRVTRVDSRAPPASATPAPASAP